MDISIGRIRIMNFIKGENWYAVHTKSNHEDIVEHHLSQLDVEILNPKQKKKRTVWGRPTVVRTPLFPGYLFVRFDPARTLHTIQYTRGVRKVLHFGATLLRVEDEIINDIKGRLDKDNCVELEARQLHYGDQVSVNDGALNGLRGVFKREMNDRKRVVLLMEILGASAEVVIDRHLLHQAA